MSVFHSISDSESRHVRAVSSAHSGQLGCPLRAAAVPPGACRAKYRARLRGMQPRERQAITRSPPGPARSRSGKSSTLKVSSQIGRQSLVLGRAQLSSCRPLLYHASRKTGAGLQVALLTVGAHPGKSTVSAYQLVLSRAMCSRHLYQWSCRVHCYKTC